MIPHQLADEDNRTWPPTSRFLDGEIAKGGYRWVKCRDLLNRGDYSRHYSDDVLVEVRGTDQRYRGREAAKNWVEGIHAVGEIKVRNTFLGETHAVAEAELVRKDGISVPYSVIYDVAAGKIIALRLYFTGPVQP